MIKSRMNEESFLQQREPDWKRLMVLTDRASITPGRLPSAELREFVELYRRVSADLSYVRTQSTNTALTDFLNDLVGRAYVTLYRPVRMPLHKALGAAALGFADTVRRLRYAILVSFVVFAAGIAFVPLAVTSKPELKTKLIPEQWVEVFDKWKHGDMEKYTADQAVGMTAFYSANNPRVAIITGSAAAGSFGILTTQLLFSNGLLLGSLATELAEVNRVGYLIQHVSPHGATEVTALILAGSAGYWMAWALISPGRKSRGESLKGAGKDAIIMLAGSFIMMFIAAPIEGFVSFNAAVPMPVKMAVTVLSVIAWTAYFVGYGRGSGSSAIATG